MIWPRGGLGLVTDKKTKKNKSRAEQEPRSVHGRVVNKCKLNNNDPSVQESVLHKGQTVRKVMGGGKKNKKDSCKAKCLKKKIMKGKTLKKKIHAQDELHFDILNQNYNSSRKVFQNAPNGIRPCLDFQNFHLKIHTYVPMGLTGIFITIFRYKVL